MEGLQLKPLKKLPEGNAENWDRYFKETLFPEKKILQTLTLKRKLLKLIPNRQNLQTLMKELLRVVAFVSLSVVGCGSAGFYIGLGWDLWIKEWNYLAPWERPTHVFTHVPLLAVQSIASVGSIALVVLWYKLLRRRLSKRLGKPKADAYGKTQFQSYCAGMTVDKEGLDGFLASNPAQALMEVAYEHTATGQNALHFLCAGPSAKREWIEIVHEAFPKCVRKRDHAKGRYPMHYLAANFNCTLESFSCLLHLFDGALLREDDDGHTPLQLLVGNLAADIEEYVPVIEKHTDEKKAAFNALKPRKPFGWWKALDLEKTVDNAVDAMFGKHECDKMQQIMAKLLENVALSYASAFASSAHAWCHRKGEHLGKRDLAVGQWPHECHAKALDAAKNVLIKRKEDEEAIERKRTAEALERERLAKEKAAEEAKRAEEERRKEEGRLVNRLKAVCCRCGLRGGATFCCCCPARCRNTCLPRDSKIAPLMTGGAKNGEEKTNGPKSAALNELKHTEVSVLDPDAKQKRLELEENKKLFLQFRRLALEKSGAVLVDKKRITAKKRQLNTPSRPANKMRLRGLLGGGDGDGGDVKRRKGGERKNLNELFRTSGEKIIAAQRERRRKELRDALLKQGESSAVLLQQLQARNPDIFGVAKTVDEAPPAVAVAEKLPPNVQRKLRSSADRIRRRLAPAKREEDGEDGTAETTTMTTKTTMAYGASPSKPQVDEEHRPDPPPSVATASAASGDSVAQADDDKVTAGAPPATSATAVVGGAQPPEGPDPPVAAGFATQANAGPVPSSQQADKKGKGGTTPATAAAAVVASAAASEVSENAVPTKAPSLRVDSQSPPGVAGINKALAGMRRASFDGSPSPPKRKRRADVSKPFATQREVMGGEEDAEEAMARKRIFADLHERLQERHIRPVDSGGVSAAVAAKRWAVKVRRKSRKALVGAKKDITTIDEAGKGEPTDAKTVHGEERQTTTAETAGAPPTTTTTAEKGEAAKVSPTPEAAAAKKALAAFTKAPTATANGGGMAAIIAAATTAAPKDTTPSPPPSGEPLASKVSPTPAAKKGLNKMPTARKGSLFSKLRTYGRFVGKVQKFVVADTAADWKSRTMDDALLKHMIMYMVKQTVVKRLSREFIDQLGQLHEDLPKIEVVEQCADKVQGVIYDLADEHIENMFQLGRDAAGEAEPEKVIKFKPSAADLALICCRAMGLKAPEELTIPSMRSRVKNLGGSKMARFNPTREDYVKKLGKLLLKRGKVKLPIPPPEKLCLEHIILVQK